MHSQLGLVLHSRSSLSTLTNNFGNGQLCLKGSTDTSKGGREDIGRAAVPSRRHPWSSPDECFEAVRTEDREAGFQPAVRYRALVL